MTKTLIKTMNKRQRSAYIQIIHAANLIVGSYENSVSDGEIAAMPPFNKLVENIFMMKL